MGDAHAMSHEDDEYMHGRPEWLTDDIARAGLAPREGDMQPNFGRNRYPNARWGATTKISNTGPTPSDKTRKTSATVVVTPVFNAPWPIGYQIQFSTDGRSFSSVCPADCGIDVEIIRSFDPKAGQAVEAFGIGPGETQPRCQTIARAVTITIKAAETMLDSVWVNVVACQLTALDCDVVVPPPPATPAAMTLTQRARYAAVTATTYQVAAFSRRGLLTIINQSNANLYVALGSDVDIDPGDESATIVIPPGVFGGFEVVNYTGPVTFRFDADDAPGYAVVTEGLYPP